MSNAEREDLVEPDTSNHCTADDIRRVLEKLEGKKDRQWYIGDVIDRMDLSGAALEALVYVSEYAFANKFYAEFVRATKKALQLPGDASRVHELLDKLIHTSRTHFLKRMPKESLIDVAGLYVEIASRYHEGCCFMEMFQSLESIGRVVSITKTFPERKCTVAYFRFLSEVFLSRCMFFSLLNALARLVMLNPHFRSQLSESEFAVFFGKLLALARFKHEGDVFQRLFGGLAMLSVEEARKIIEKDMLYEQPVAKREGWQCPVLGDDYVMWLWLDSRWDAVLSMQPVALSNDTIPFLSFLRKNNVEFALEDGCMRIVGHCHRSVTHEVFLLKQRFSVPPQTAASRGETAREKANLLNTKYYLFKPGGGAPELVQSNDIFGDTRFARTRSHFWLNIFNPLEHDLRMLHELYDVHDISLTDIRDRDTEEKIEMFRHYTFISLRLCGFRRLNPTEDIDFNILIFKNFVVTTHDKPWIGINDIVNFLSLICEHTPFSPDWVVYSIVIEFLQDIKHIIQTICPDAERSVTQDRDLERLLHTNFDTACALFDLWSFIKPKRQILRAIVESERFKKKIARVFEVALGDFTVAEEQTKEYIRTVERAQDLILALVDMKQTKEANEMSRAVNRFSFVAFVFLPCQTIAGLWGMNVRVPFYSTNAADSLMPFLFLCLLGPLISACILLAGRFWGDGKRSGR
ncbi:UNVERIFIED_CONTAM: hypothetical protein PYX00_011588 [Menopon gallinae]|uniref:Uncharacterized protein n=1 Tax=Menopon gallinae TaxID=328185 RepID=A0AAW2H843_9NEOP